MSVRVRERAVLRATPERVWDVLTDWERQATWMPDVVWIKVLGPDRELGARLAVRTRVFGIPFTTDVARVTAWEPARRLAVEHEGVVRGRGEWTLDPMTGGTRFTWVEDLELPPPKAGDLMFRAYAPVQRWMMRRSIANLRHLVEDGTPG